MTSPTRSTPTFLECKALCATPRAGEAPRPFLGNPSSERAAFHTSDSKIATRNREGGRTYPGARRRLKATALEHNSVSVVGH
jgi:hypothetical protein